MKVIDLISTVIWKDKATEERMLDELRTNNSLEVDNKNIVIKMGISINDALDKVETPIENGFWVYYFNAEDDSKRCVWVENMVAAIELKQKLEENPMVVGVTVVFIYNEEIHICKIVKGETE